MREQVSLDHLWQEVTQELAPVPPEAPAPVVVGQRDLDRAIDAGKRLSGAPLAAPAQGRGVIFRGGVAYYPAPTGTAADGINTIDDGYGQVYYRATADVAPWEYGAVPGGIYNGPDSGVALDAWLCGAQGGQKLWLPPGYWWTSRPLRTYSANCSLDFRGVLSPLPGFNPHDYVISLDAGADPQPAYQWPDGSSLPSYYDNTLQGALWYKRIQVEALTVNACMRSRGVLVSRWDHYDVRNINVNKARGAGITWDRNREGNAYNLIMTFCQSQADVPEHGEYHAVFELVEQGPGDTANACNFFGIRVAGYQGRGFLMDSPHMYEREAANIGAPNLSARFVYIYGLSVEEITAEGSTLDDVHRVYPDPSIDRVWFRRARYVSVFGGLCNGGDIGSGSVIRIGDSSIRGADGQPDARAMPIAVHIDCDVYAFKGDGFAYKVDPGAVNVKIGKEPWLGDSVKPVQWPGGQTVPSEIRQPELIRMPGYQAAYRAVADSGGAAPSVQLGDGYGNTASYGQRGTEDRAQSLLVEKPDVGKNTEYVRDLNGRMYSSGAPLRIGTTGHEAAWLMMGPQTQEPWEKTRGTIAVADGNKWDPLGRSGRAPYIVMFDGTKWQPLA